ncbi:hypothetical protein POSPLADRAFT_1055879 [Postia placenta MAD-698-R-SB12]|uniref:Uncharacterized protein n=1 Tax=Postia placenta MAD-698-R-SB12 TaxID=670580 RepID=A0A1X6N5A6_9APHY|nr:hypothetical protein POSPLADRAFT_1055879 [Postia placenta MAD-698-R-SB12]OSX63798.1 hypothetical protein POSPLADRAFT_1055879 [Postia placenta MAD-698-R-SB12]
MSYGHPEGTVRFHFYQTFEINPNFLREKTSMIQFKEACLPPENSPKRGGRMTYGHPEGTIRFHFYQTFEINPNFLRKKTSMIRDRIKELGPI